MSGGLGQDTEARIESLSRQVEDLLALCERLRTENESLRHQQETLSGERARLIESRRAPGSRR